jgi:hypothetical protein
MLNFLYINMLRATENVKFLAYSDEFNAELFPESGEIACLAQLA